MRKALTAIFSLFFSVTLFAIGPQEELEAFVSRYLAMLESLPALEDKKARMLEDQIKISGSPDCMHYADKKEFRFSGNGRGEFLCSRTGKGDFCISFPLDYSLISGKSKIELEKELPAALLSFSGYDIPLDSEKYIKEFRNVYKCGGNKYYSEEVLNVSYAVRTENQLTPLIDIRYPRESVMTLLTEPEAGKGFDLEIMFVRYGYKNEVINLPLNSFLSYMITSGCIPYVGIEKIGPTEISASLFLVNERLGYNHVLKVTIFSESLKNKNGIVKSRMNAFIPTWNLSDLYSK